MKKTNSFKALCVLLSAALMSTCIAFTACAEEPQEMEPYINDSFENDFGGWQIGEVSADKYKAEMTVENGNLHMTTGNIGGDCEKGQAPNIYRLINDGAGLKAESGKNIVIKTRFKVTQADTRTFLKINRPLAVSDLEAGDGGLSFYSVFIYNKGDVFITNGNGSANEPYIYGDNKIATGCTGKWIELKMVLRPNADGTVFEKADYYVNIDGTSYGPYTDKVLPTADRTNAWSQWDALRSITFTTRQNANTTDVDYFKLYEYYTVAKANIVFKNTEYFVGDDEIALQFNTNVNNVNTYTVSLKNEAGELIDYRGDYVASERKYILSPNVTLADGKYFIEIKTDSIELPSEVETNDIPERLEFQYYAEPLKFPPYAENVHISGKAQTGRCLSGVYTFKDSNGDAENVKGSIYKWYISDNEYDGYTLVDGMNESQYTIDESDLGKFIKFSVQVCSEEEPYMAEEEIFSEPIGPITKYEAKNYLTNGNFETGELSPWNVISCTAGDNLTISIVNDNAYEGNHALSVKGRKINSSTWGEAIKIENNKSYIFDGYVMVDPESSLSGFNCEAYWNNAQGGKIDRPYRDKETVTAVKNKWTHVAQTITVTGTEEGTTNVSPNVMCWPGGATGYDYYVDDLYVGQLEIGDIAVDLPDSIQIPQNGEVTYELSGKALNQRGAETGLYNETVEFSCGDINGVYIDGNTLHITSEAVTGNIDIYASCEPKFFGATAENKFVKKCNMELTSNGDKKPRISNVILSGTVEEGANIYLSYKYYQADGEKDASVIEWYYADSENGEYKIIPEATGKNYVITEEYKNAFIKVKITPKTEKGITNNTVWSNVVGVASPPKAKNIEVAGKFVVGGKLIGSYEYDDINDSPEGESRFRWMRSSTENGLYTAIDGASAQEYELTDDDIEMYIKFEVTPISSVEPCEGAVYTSKAYKGPVYPQATKVSIKKSGNYLTGIYTYEHAYNIEEGESLLKWYVNGSFVGTGSSYWAGAGDKVTFEVTPVAKEKPYMGKPVTSTVSIASSSNGGSGGSAGSGSHGRGSVGFTSGADSVLDSFVENTPKAINAVADISGHWSEKAVKNVVDKAIMETDANNNFYPERKASRKEVVKWVANALELNTKYKNEFADVSADDIYADALQALVDIDVISKDEKFYPDREISRQEMAKILVKVYEYKNIAVEKSVDISMLFADYGDISEWAREYVESVVSYGIMVGVGENRFAPKDNITKAQVATVICNMLERMEAEK